MVELRLTDGTRLELRGDEVIALTYAVNDIGNIETRQGVSSNEFELPITDFNLKALGYPTNFNVNQNVNPFTKIDAEIYEDELRIAKGYIQITNPSLSGNTIPVVFFGENAEWFNLIKGKSIRETNLSEFNHAFTPANIVGSFSNTEGYKYTLIDRNGLNFLSGNVLATQCFTISTFQSSIAKAIIEGIGYKIKGDVFNDPLYKNTLIPDTNNKFYALNTDSGFVRDVYIGNKFTSYISGIETTIDFDIIQSALGQFTKDGNNFNVNTDTYTADSGMLINLYASFNVSNFTTATPTDVTIRLKKNGVTVQTNTQTGVLAGTRFTFTYQDTLDANDTLLFTIEPATEDVVIQEPGLINNFTTLVNYLSIRVEDIALDGSVININATLPDVDQAEFIKDMVFDNNALVTVNLSTKEISFDKKRYNQNNFLYWSEKIDLSESVEINYTTLLENYGRISELKRAEDDGAFIEKYNAKNTIKFGDGEFTLTNEFLEPRKTIYDSPFASTLVINSLNLNQPLPYIYSDAISDVIQVQQFNGLNIEVGFDNDIDDILEDTPQNSIWALVTESDNSTYNRAYGVVGITKDEINEVYIITTNFTFTANATGVVRLIKRDEESTPRKLLDGGNYSIEDINETYTDYTVNDTKANTETFTEIPYFYFYNEILGLPTDALIDSLSYGDNNINSRCINLLDRNYTDTIKTIQNGKVLKASFRLTQIDIFNLDFTKLVYLNFYINGQSIQGYFIINKIEEYTGSEDSTVVELIKY